MKVRYLHTGDKLYSKIDDEIQEYTLEACNKNHQPIELALKDAIGNVVFYTVKDLGKNLFLDRTALEVRCGQFLYYADEEGSIKHCIVLRIDKNGFIVQCENDKTYFINFDLVGKKVFINLADVPKRRRKPQPNLKPKPKKYFKKKKSKKQYRSKGIEKADNSVPYMSQYMSSKALQKDDDWSKYDYKVTGEKKKDK